jgi:hypothetical protein
MKPGEGPAGGAGFWWLERITGGLLLAVILSLIWMLLVANGVDALRLGEPGVEVMVVLVLLAAALVLVSVVALLHTGEEARETGTR